MQTAHVSQSGNISIPKSWRDELGIEPNSEVIIEKRIDCITIEPLRKRNFKEICDAIGRDMKKKNIVITREEAIADDLYD